MLFKVSLLFLAVVFIVVIIQLIYVAGYLQCKCGNCYQCKKAFMASQMRKLRSSVLPRSSGSGGCGGSAAAASGNNPMTSASPTATAHLLCSDVDKMGAADGEAPSFMMSEQNAPPVVTSPHQSVASLGCVRSHI